MTGHIPAELKRPDQPEEAVDSSEPTDRVEIPEELGDLANLEITEPSEQRNGLSGPDPRQS